jgi:hypothetical protein
MLGNFISPKSQKMECDTPADLVFLGEGASLVSYSRVEKQENFCTFVQFEPIVSKRLFTTALLCRFLARVWAVQSFSKLAKNIRKI